MKSTFYAQRVKLGFCSVVFPVPFHLVPHKWVISNREKKGFCAGTFMFPLKNRGGFLWVLSCGPKFVMTLFVFDQICLWGFGFCAGAELRPTDFFLEVHYGGVFELRPTGKSLNWG